MDAIEFLNSEEAELPKTRPDKVHSFQTDLSNYFSAYLDKLAQVNSTDYTSTEIRKRQGVIKEFCDDIITALQSYDSGLPHAAFATLDAAINSRLPDFEHLVTRADYAKALEFMYRIRVGDGFHFSKEELFHIPFQKRHLVTPQRYSIPGVPCLYLGASLYVCWEELGRPDVDRIHMVRFRPKSGATIKVLNFGYRPALVAAMLDRNRDKMIIESNPSNLAIAHAAFWPLIAACSVRVKFRSAPFKPEYIIPQLVLQWIQSNSSYDGVRYFSTHVGEYLNDPFASSNFAFPVKKIEESGYCPVLRDKFEFTEPLAWQLADLFQINASTSQHTNFDIQLVKGLQSSYEGSKFASMQEKLASLDCESLH